METHHRQLLRSNDGANVVFGYLSVLFWGHSSGQNPTKSLGPKALSRVQMAELKVNGLGVDEAAEHIRRAARLVDGGEGGAALLELSNLPQLGFACLEGVRLHSTREMWGC